MHRGKRDKFTQHPAKNAERRPTQPAATAQENLARAFLTFTQAAGSLEKSYTHLQAEVTRLHAELQRTNCELERSVEENARVRGYLSRVLESLPCGVLVVSAEETIEIINPEARRLLQLDPRYAADGGTLLAAPLVQTLRDLPGNRPLSEQEHSIAVRFRQSYHRHFSRSLAKRSNARATPFGFFATLPRRNASPPSGRPHAAPMPWRK